MAIKIGILRSVTDETDSRDHDRTLCDDLILPRWWPLAKNMGGRVINIEISCTLLVNLVAEKEVADCAMPEVQYHKN